MARAVTLFTGQWADLTLDTIAEKAAAWGYDRLELACWGDHFEVDKALAVDLRIIENVKKFIAKLNNVKSAYYKDGKLIVSQ